MFAVCGIASPILFVTLLLVAGLLRPGYSHVTQPISELGQIGTPNAIIQDANFVLTGLLIIPFAVGLHRGIDQGRGSKIGPTLLLVFAVTGVLVGTIFPLPDPLHVPVSLIGFIAMIIGIFAIYRRLRRAGQWQGYGSYSLATGAVLVVLFFLTGIGGQGILAPWFGLLQRLFAAPLFLWIEVIALRLYMLPNRSSP